MADEKEIQPQLIEPRMILTDFHGGETRVEALMLDIQQKQAQALGINPELLREVREENAPYGTNLCREVLLGENQPVSFGVAENVRFVSSALTPNGMEHVYEASSKKKSPAASSRHVVNEEQARDYCIALADGHNPRVTKWAWTVFRHWMVHDSQHASKRILDERECQSQSFKMSYEANMWQFRDVVFANLETLPAWARNRYSEGQHLYIWTRPHEQQHSQYAHWLDYLEQAEFKNTDYQMNVGQVMKAVLAWDKRLAKQKLKQSLYDEAVRVECEVLDGTGWELYKLPTAGARKAEGQYMGHCVGDDVYGRGQTTIYSIRSAQNRVSLYTVEVKQNPIHDASARNILHRRRPTYEEDPAKMTFYIAQMKGRFNEVVVPGDRSLIEAALKSVEPRIGQRTGMDDLVIRFLDTPEMLVNDFFTTQAMSRMHRSGAGVYIDHFIDRYADILRPPARPVWEHVVTIDSASPMITDAAMELKVLKKRPVLDNEAVKESQRYYLPEEQPPVQLTKTAKAIKPDNKARTASWSGNPFNQPKKKALWQLK